MRSSIALNVAGSNTLSAASIAQAFVKFSRHLDTKEASELLGGPWMSGSYDHVMWTATSSTCATFKLAREVLILNVQICKLYCTLLYCTCMTSKDLATWSSCLWFHKQYHEVFHYPQDLWTIQNQAPSLLGGFLRAHKPNEFGDCCIQNSSDMNLFQFWKVATCDNARSLLEGHPQ